MVTAYLKNYRQSPRKVRLVADLVKGKSVDQAVASLNNLAKRAAGPLEKLLLSAIANAKNNHNLDLATLFVKEFRVDGGAILKRSMPRARGSASRINKRTSHVIVTLAPKAPKKIK